MLASAQQELVAFQDMYNRMQHQCWKKCVLRLGESELSVSEGLCADRCVKKYMEVHNRVGKVLQGLQQQQPQPQ